MAGGEEPSAGPGKEKFFNTITNRGRRNCTVASLAFYAGLFLFLKLKPSSKK